MTAYSILKDYNKNISKLRLCALYPVYSTCAECNKTQGLFIAGYKIPKYTEFIYSMFICKKCFKNIPFFIVGMSYKELELMYDHFESDI